MAKRKALADAFKAQTPFVDERHNQSNNETENKPQGKTKGYLAPSRIGKKFVGGYVDADVAKQLKLMAVEQDTTSESLIKEAINDLFQKHGKPRIA